MSDSPIFLPSDDLKNLFAELEQEFEDQVDSLLESPIKDDESVLLVSKEKFMEGFRIHTHRYQQMYVLLKDINLLENTLLEVKFMTAILGQGYAEGMMLPVIRQDDDLMYVGFEYPPIDLDSFSTDHEHDLITIAGVPLLPTDVAPYNGASVLSIGTGDDMEVVLVMQNPQEHSIVLIWGDFVVSNLSTGDPKSLN